MTNDTSKMDVIPETVWAFLDELTPDDVGTEVIDGWTVRFEGFSGICLDDVERRMGLPADHPDHLGSLEDALEEVAAEFRDAFEDIRQEGVLGDEDPIVWAISREAPDVDPSPD